MAFSYPYSRIAQAMRPSPIRELFALTQRPGMISFAGGLPDPAIFPVERFAECADVLLGEGRTALQYGATEGYAPLVGWVCQRMTAFLGQPVSPAQVAIASGSQQLLDMLARVLLDPGDVVLVESPTYPGALHTLRNAGARFMLVPSDGDGIFVEALPELVERCRRETGQAPKLLYTVINFSNPSGATLSLQRRRQLAALLPTLGVPVLEDDPYGELRFEAEPIPPLYSLAGGQGVLYASSFSKILAPGTRVAWAVGEAELIRRLVLAKQGMDLCTSMVTQVLVAEYCRRGHLDAHLAAIRRHYAVKAEAMEKALETHLAAHASWTRPQGGFFYWLSLPGQDCQELFQRAVAAGVAFLPGRAFYPDASETVGEPAAGREFLRLCFTFAQPEEIQEGCRRLATALSAPASQPSPMHGHAIEDHGRRA
jgi:2-aminoadipate transaminase